MGVLILKVWEGIITGSFAGRDDGYPITKYTVYDNLASLAQDHGKDKKERYYHMTEIDAETIDALVANELEIQQIAKEEEVRRRKLADYNKLKDELGL